MAWAARNARWVAWNERHVGWDDPIGRLHFVGPVMRAQLRAQGVRTPRDLHERFRQSRRSKRSNARWLADTLVNTRRDRCLNRRSPGRPFFYRVNPHNTYAYNAIIAFLRARAVADGRDNHRAFLRRLPAVKPLRPVAAAFPPVCVAPT